MVSVEEKSNSNYLITLSPNSSLTGVYRIIFLASISFICVGIAIVFYFFGAYLILPFAGIEIAILLIAFYISFKWSSRKELIYISQEVVKIEKGIHKAEYLWEEFRTFTSFQIAKDANKSLRLSFRSKGDDIIVGDFLNEDDKNILINEIRNIIDELNLEAF